MSVSGLNFGIPPLRYNINTLYTGFSNSEQETEETSIKKYPCPNCRSAFTRKNGLVCHIRYECNQQPHFKCPYCSYVSKKSSNVQKHVRGKHPGQPVSYIFI